MLREMQHAFARGLLLDEPDDALAYLRPASRARFAIHRNTVIGSLVAALGDTFPATRCSLGEAAFRETARDFVAVRPPLRPQLLAWGEEFPAFLGAASPAGAPAWTGDLAALEWARNVALFAADGTPLEARDLVGLAEADYPALALALVPGASLVASPWPIAALRARLEAGGCPDGAPTTPAQTVLVWRAAGRVEETVLGAGAAALLGAVDSGATLGEAAALALEAEPGLDLQTTLAGHLAGGCLAVRAAPASRPT